MAAADVTKVNKVEKNEVKKNEEFSGEKDAKLSMYWSSSAENRLLACLGYDRIKTSESDLELLLKLTRMVDQVEQANLLTKSIGRKKCYTRLMKCKYDVDKTVASFFHEAEAQSKFSRRSARSSNADLRNEVSNRIEVSSHDDNCFEPCGEDHDMNDGVLSEGDPMLSSTPGKNIRARVVTVKETLPSPSDGPDISNMAALEDVKGFALTGGDGSTYTVTVDAPMQSEDNSDQSRRLEALPFDSVTNYDVNEARDDSCDTIISYDQNLPPVIFEENGSTATSSEKKRKVEMRQKSDAINEHSADGSEMGKQFPERQKQPSKSKKDATKKTLKSERSTNHEKLEVATNENKISDTDSSNDIIIQDSEDILKTDKNGAPEKTNNIPENLVKGKKLSKVKKTSTEFEDSSEAESMISVGRQNEKRKRRANGTMPSPRDYIIHGEPREIEEILPLALTYGTEPKKAYYEQILDYIQKYCPSVEHDKLQEALDVGIESGNWSKVIGVENLYQLLTERIDPASDTDLEGIICNAILASNKPKWARFQSLKNYLLDFHSDFLGVSSRNVAQLKKALDRAVANNLIRPIGGKARSVNMTYELVPDFVPAPLILQGDDTERDYFEWDDSQKLRWTPVDV